MISRCPLWLAAGVLFVAVGAAQAQQTGSIRGLVYDRQYDLPLSGAEVTVQQTRRKATTQQGSFTLSGLEPGRYDLVITKEGFRRKLRTDVVVSAGEVSQVTVYMEGEIQEMEEFVVEDIEIGGGDEESLLDLRIETPTLLDSVGEDVISSSGAGDAADALRLVAGATVAEGKYAVIRGLPDRYVNSQLNALRLPTADSEKRAVQLDQFPSDIIQSVQVSKTFTPDQQGDASGGAVNVVLQGIPRDSFLGFGLGYAVNENVQKNRTAFLSHEGGDLDYWGFDGGRRDIQYGNIGDNWTGAVGSERIEAPKEYDWSLSGGLRHEFDGGLTVGALANVYYARGASHVDEGIDDSWWVTTPGNDLSPVTDTGNSAGDDFYTSLFDYERSTQSVSWGGLGVLGAEIPGHSVRMLYLYTRDAENAVTLAEDTRGKEYYYPDFDPYDPEGEGNKDMDTAPYLRMQTLKYTERETRTLQFSGDHELPMPEIGIHLGRRGGEAFWTFLAPEIDWMVGTSRASLYEPDKRQFGSEWQATWHDPGVPFLGIPPEDVPPQYRPFKPAANINLGNLQRIYKEVIEESDQYGASITFPFRQWTGHEGYFKLGYFHDEVDRTFDQETFTNGNDPGPKTYQADWFDFWSDVFPDQEHPVKATEFDTDYIGVQEITAWYHMVDIPLCRAVSFVGGARYERTELSIINIPEDNVTWFPPGEGTTKLNPGDADVMIKQDDILPMIGFVFQPFDQITLRGSRTETIARQTFKELTPIQQQEYLGADVFIGNPELRISSLKNYDLRLDYRPTTGGLLSISWFHKKITDPIEYVQQFRNFTNYTTAVNYPEGELTGWEFEIRQNLGAHVKQLQGLSVGANATFIESEVTLPKDEAQSFRDWSDRIRIKKRDMLNAPEYLYNLYMTYDVPDTGTRLGVFYTVRGDTLVAGPAITKGNFVPGVYETEYGTLNVTVSQKLNDIWKVKFSAKNLLNPKIQSVYRSEYIDDDVVKTSYRKGIDFSISISAEW